MDCLLGCNISMGVKPGLSDKNKEHRLRVFENRVPRRKFGSEREELEVRWR
jgi:hypothetical protein